MLKTKYLGGAVYGQERRQPVQRYIKKCEMEVWRADPPDMGLLSICGQQNG